jgi:hypothetical protein
VKKIVLAATAGLLLLGGTACAYENPGADEVGLYYEEGSLDGQKFLQCVNPGESIQTMDGFEDEDTIYPVPASLRTWNIAPNGGDSNVPITVAAAPEAGQPSGVQVNLWLQFAFTINSSCGADNKDPNSPAVQWWEKVGRRYYTADGTENKTEWWGKMLQNTIVPAAEAVSRTKARAYSGDALVSGSVNVELQKAVSADLPAELKRLTGGNYFCAPTFNRANPDQCGAVEVLLKDVDYTNPEIQAARDQKQKAVELAAALVAEAQGKVDAAAKQAELYKNPAWVQLEQAKIELEKAKAQAAACEKAASCTIVSGGGGVLVGAK